MDTNALPGSGGRAASTCSFELDPCAVLGISSSATLSEIRDAYRLKVKKHHPDQGGDDWAFRIVARCYEIVSATRVIGHALRDVKPRDADRAAPAPTPSPGGADPFHLNPDQEWVRPGQHDAGIAAGRMVDVEIFVVRYEFTDPMEVFDLPPEERRLCSCLNLTWSAPGGVSGGPERADHASVLRCLSKAFSKMPSRTKALSSWSRPGGEGEEFVGWLSYPTVTQAWDAFVALREALHECGLGVNQWTREMTVHRGRGS